MAVAVTHCSILDPELPDRWLEMTPEGQLMRSAQGILRSLLLGTLSQVLHQIQEQVPSSRRLKPGDAAMTLSNRVGQLHRFLGVKSPLCAANLDQIITLIPLLTQDLMARYPSIDVPWALLSRSAKYQVSDEPITRLTWSADWGCSYPSFITATVFLREQEVSLARSSIDNVLELLVAANEFGLPGLRRLCTDHLAQRITPQNWWSIYHTALQIERSSHLVAHCLAFYPTAADRIPAESRTASGLPPDRLEAVGAVVNAIQGIEPEEVERPPFADVRAKRDLVFVDAEAGGELDFHEAVLKCVLPRVEFPVVGPVKGKQLSRLPPGLSFEAMQALQQWIYGGQLPMGWSGDQWMELLNLLHGSPVYESLRRRALETPIPLADCELGARRRLIDQHQAWPWASCWYGDFDRESMPESLIVLNGSWMVSDERRRAVRHLVVKTVADREVCFPLAEAATVDLPEQRYLKEALPHLRQLKYLCLRQSPSEENLIALLKQNPGLEILWIQGDRPVTIDPVLLPRHCRALFGQIQLDLTRALPWLPDLEMLTCHVESYRTVQRHSRLRYVELNASGSTQLSRLLTGCQGLEVLRCGDEVTWLEEPPATFAARGLRSIHNARLTDPVIGWLSQLKGLRHLSLNRRSQCTAAGIHQALIRSKIELLELPAMALADIARAFVDCDNLQQIRTTERTYRRGEDLGASGGCCVIQ